VLASGTLVSDPRRTGTVTGLEDIDPRNSHNFQTLNGDISYLNAIAHVILTKHPEAVMPEEWLERHTSGWREYIEGIKARYSPQQVVERLRERGVAEPEARVEQARRQRSLPAEHDRRRVAERESQRPRGGREYRGAAERASELIGELGVLDRLGRVEDIDRTLAEGMECGAHGERRTIERRRDSEEDDADYYRNQVSLGLSVVY